MKYRIEWRNRAYGYGMSIHPVIKGISRYPTEMKAKAQVELFKRIAPIETEFYIIPILEF